MANASKTETTSSTMATQRFDVTSPGYHPAQVEKFHRDAVAHVEQWEQKGRAWGDRENFLMRELEAAQNMVRRLTVEVEVLRVSGEIPEEGASFMSGGSSSGTPEAPVFQPGWTPNGQ